MPTVSKATSRKRGAAKTVRAAQRTPLPVLDLPADAIRGLSSTGMVHWARPTGHGGRLEQLCGANPKQHAYLSPAPDDAVSCKRCLSRYGDSKIKESAPVQDALSDNLDTAEPTETIPSEGPIKRGTPANKKVPQFDPKASAKQDAKSEPSKVDPKVAKAIGERVLALRKEYTRGVVAAAAGTTPSVVWRWEQGRPKVDELPAIEALFAKIDAGEVTKPERKAFGKVQGGPTKADLVSTIEQVRHVLSDVPATGLKVGQAREAISTCLDLIEKTMSSGEE